MGKNNVLYDRNHVGYAKDIGAKKLYIDGVLPAAEINKKYDGRLQIHNNVGACSVEVLSGGDGLPSGANVYVDNATYEVVVAWPAVNPTPVQLINPSFETGDTSGWTTQTIGGSGTLVASSDYKDVGMYSAYWAGGKGLGSEGGIECLAFNDAKGPVIPGQVVTAKLRVMYNPGGGTPKGSRGQAKLAWYRSNDTLISMSDGFLIKTRKYNGKWTDTVVSDRAVPEAAYVKLVAWVTATGAGHTYFDNASWDIPASSGGDFLGTINLSLKVTDSIGRIAYWTGSVTIYNGYSGAVLLDSPVAYWKADETVGPTMYDSSGNGHHATYTGFAGVVLNTPPLRNGASGSLSTTTTTLAASIPYASQLDVMWYTNKGGVMECIVKKTAKGGSVLAQFFAGLGSILQTNNSMQYRFGTANDYLVWDPGNANKNSPNKTSGQTVHAVIELTATDGNGLRTWKMYENGTQVATGTITSSLRPGFGSLICFMGDRDYASSYGFIGSCSDFALYDHLLGPDKIRAHASLAGLYVGV